MRGAKECRCLQCSAMRFGASFEKGYERVRRHSENGVSQSDQSGLPRGAAISPLMLEKRAR